MEEFLGKMVNIIVDRPLGSAHPKYGYIYPINYGYIPNTLSGDGEEIDAYILGEIESISNFEGFVIGIIKRKNDNEDKLVVSKYKGCFSKQDILELTEFQEKYFDIDIII